MALADHFQEIVDSLPSDWTDLELDLRVQEDRYVDAAVGTLARDAAGRLAMTVVRLRPQVAFGGDRRPDAEELARLHHEAHAQCFIANSVKTEVRCEPVP